MRGASQRGGAPVGSLSDLPPVEAGAVMFLRQWDAGDHARAQLKKDFDLALGEDRSDIIARTFDKLCELCAIHGRRPLVRHTTSCKCLGADEACFAHFVAAAAAGEHEDATLFAMLIVRPDMAPYLVGLAETVGLALTKMTVRYAQPAQTSSVNHTLH